MNKLPKIYHTNIDKKLNNNKEMCVVEEVRNNSISDTLNKVYAGLGNKYNTNVIIETGDKKYDTSLIYKSNKELITKENEMIDVRDIRNITIKK